MVPEYLVNIGCGAKPWTTLIVNWNTRNKLQLNSNKNISFKKLNLNMWSAKWWPFCFELIGSFSHLFLEYMIYTKILCTTALSILHSDVANTHYQQVFVLQWRWRLKSPALRLFTQPLIQAQIKENIKAPRHWPLWGEFTGDRWIPRTKGQWRGKCFHLVTSSCADH